MLAGRAGGLHGALANDLRSRATRLRNGEIPGGGKGLSYYNYSYNNLSSSFYDLYRVVVFSPLENAYGLLPSNENVIKIS